MGAFVFRLAALLRVRELRQREAQRRVALTRRELARLDELDRQAHTEIQRTQTELRGSQSQERLDPAALTRARAWIGQLRRAVLLRDRQKVALARRLEQELQQLRDARTQTRILEKLRDQRLQAWQHDRAVHEQALTDEAAQNLLRFAPAQANDEAASDDERA